MLASLNRAGENDKPLIAEMMQVYLTELSAYSAVIVAENGHFQLGPIFDAYWQEPQRTPFLVTADDEMAGFCLVREVEPDLHAIAEFYIAPAFRHHGIGTGAAISAFQAFPGRWQVAQLEHNKIAQHFWRHVIGQVTGNTYTENWSADHPAGPIQYFTLPGSDA